MDDPYILAFDVKLPFPKNEFGQGLTLLRVWHKDPRTNGHPDPDRHGDVAGWTFPRLSAKEVAYADYLAGKDNDIDNLSAFFPALKYEERRAHIRQIFRLHKKIARPWWRHPRWHIWNWRLTPE